MLSLKVPRGVLGAAVLAPLAGAWAAPQGADDQTARFGAKTTLVQVDVVAVDAQGTPVSGLTAQDFEVREDGTPVEIEMLRTGSAAAPRPPVPTSGQRLWTNTEGGAGRTLFIVFDDLGLTATEAEQARRAAKDFLVRLQPGDSLGLASASGRLWCTGRVPEDREGLLAALQRLSGMRSPQAFATDQMTEYEAMRIAQDGDALVLKRVEDRMLRSQAPSSLPPGSDAASGISDMASPGGSPGPGGGGGKDPWMLRASAGSLSAERQLAQSLATQVYARANDRRGRLFQALARAMDSLRATEDRKAVVVMSARYLSSRDDREYAVVQDLSRRARATLYAIDVSGLSGGSAEAGERRDDEGRLTMEEQAALRAGLSSLASEGGGFAITNSNDLAAGLQRISSDVRQYYLLGYRPPHVETDGKFRQISVSVRRPGISVRARPGYFATGDEPTEVAGGGRADATLRLRRALDSPFAEPGIPLRLATYSFERTKEGATRTQLVAELRVDGLSFEKKGEQFTADIDVLMGITHYASGKSFGGKPVAARITTGGDLHGQIAWYRLAEQVELPPGASQVRFVVRDRKSGNLGSVIASVATPADDGRWRTSSLVLSDVVSSAGEGQPQHAVPQARRSFPAAGLLYSEFEVYGAPADKTSGVPRLSAGFAILRKGGKPEREETLTPLEPTRERRFARLVTVPLGRLKAGEYEFVLKLKDEVSGETREQREPFTLVRPPSPTPAVYQDLVQEYLAGRGPDALGELFAWRAADIAELVRELPAAETALVHAAAMLHTEAVLTLRAQSQPARSQEQLAIARELLARAEPQTTFRRDWLITLGALLQGSHADELALQIYQECMQAFPSAAVAWLGAGTIYEYSVYPDGLKGGGVPGQPAELLKEAERHYRQALVLDPNLAEAHLRLGRILARSGRGELALPELKRATDEGAEGTVKGLAHLFLGDLAERLGKADEALAHYRAAREQDSALQQAGLAEGALLERSGGRAVAVGALESVLSGGCALGLPRWLGYHLGLGARAETMIQELRRLVRS